MCYIRNNKYRPTEQEIHGIAAFQLLLSRIPERELGLWKLQGSNQQVGPSFLNFFFLNLITEIKKE